MAKRERDVDASVGAVKHFKSDFAEFVTLVVHDQRVLVHQDLLCSRSDFMRAACSGAGREPKAEVVRLALGEWCSVDHVRAYVTWLYSEPDDLRDLARVRQDEWEPIEDLDVSTTERLWLTDSLVALWMLGEYLQDVGFKNGVMDALLLHTECCHGIFDHTTADTVLLIWDWTPDQSALRRWLIDVMFPSFTEGNIQDFQRLDCALPPDLLLALFRKSLQERQSGVKFEEPEFVDRYEYHEHPKSGEQCA